MACRELTPRTQKNCGRFRTLSRRVLMGARARARAARLYPADEDLGRPRTTAECAARRLGTAANPCPYVGCAQHLALEISPRTGAVTILMPFELDAADGLPDLDLSAWPVTCLRVAATHGRTLDATGRLLGCTRERVRQIEVRVLARLQAAMGLGPPEKEGP